MLYWYQRLSYQKHFTVFSNNLMVTTQSTGKGETQKQFQRTLPLRCPVSVQHRSRVREATGVHRSIPHAEEISGVISP